MLGRVLGGVRNVVRFGADYVRFADFRSAVAQIDPRTNGADDATARVRLETAAAPATVRAYRGLTGGSLSLASITTGSRGVPTVVLVVPELLPRSMFAGVNTALDAASLLAKELGRELRVVTLSEAQTSADAVAVEAYLGERFGRPVGTTPRERLLDAEFHRDDVWIVTHWTTAHAAQVAVLGGVLRRDQVLYLVQDFEAGFHSWSTNHALARATYDAGFEMLVNSAPVAQYLRERVGLAVDDELVFAPHLDTARLRAVSAARSSTATRIVFYGRPSKPRNMFRLGVAALERAIDSLGERAKGIEVLSAGEAHADRELGHGVVMRSVGTLGWGPYHELLATASVVVSLQASPHPSHPPLEAAVTGSRVIVNDFEGTRQGLHPRILALPPDIESLAAGIVDALEHHSTPGAFLPMEEGRLGRPLVDAVASAAARIRGSAPAQDGSSATAAS